MPPDARRARHLPVGAEKAPLRRSAPTWASARRPSIPLIFVIALVTQGGEPRDVVFGRYVHDTGLAIPLVLLLFGSIWMFPLITALVAGDIVAAEDRHDTLKTILTRSVERHQIFAAKALAAASYAIAAIAITGASRWSPASSPRASTRSPAFRERKCPRRTGSPWSAQACSSTCFRSSRSRRSRCCCRPPPKQRGGDRRHADVLAAPAARRHPSGALGPAPVPPQHAVQRLAGLPADPVDWAPIVRAVWVCALYAVPALVAAGLDLPAPRRRERVRGLGSARATRGEVFMMHVWSGSRTSAPSRSTRSSVARGVRRPPPGVESSAMKLFYDSDQGTAVFVAFETEQQMRDADAIFQQMDASDTPAPARRSTGARSRSSGAPGSPGSRRPTPRFAQARGSSGTGAAPRSSARSLALRRGTAKRESERGDQRDQAHQERQREAGRGGDAARAEVAREQRRRQLAAEGAAERSCHGVHPGGDAGLLLAHVLDDQVRHRREGEADADAEQARGDVDVQLAGCGRSTSSDVAREREQRCRRSATPASRCGARGSPPSGPR